MTRYCVFYIYGIIYVAAMDLRILKHEGNDQSVNLALDTIVEFDNKNNGGDIAFLDNVQKFIGKVKTVIVNKNLRRNFNGVDSKKLTDFILSLIQMLLKFEDSSLEDFFTITAEEFKKYHYKGCKFYELIENYDLRKFLANKLDELRHTPANETRRSLKDFASKIEEEKYNTNEKELIDYINSLYGEKSIELFNKIISGLDDYRLKPTRDINLSKIINAGIRSIVFDYYTELNRNARVALKIKLNEFIERTIGISTYATKFVIENKKSIITTKEPTFMPKYVEQYLDLRQSAFKYDREEPLLSSVSVSYNSKKVSNIYNPDFHYQTTDRDVDIAKPGKRQKVSNSKHFKQPYLEKDRNRINYPISYKNSKKDKKNKRHTLRTMHTVRSSMVGQYDKSQGYKFKTTKEPKHVTPKEPEIRNSNLDSNEFISHDHETTTSKPIEENTVHEQVLKIRKEHFRHKYRSNITESRLLRGKPQSDPESDSKYDVEPTINGNFKQQFETDRNILKTSHKLTTGHETDIFFSDDKLVGNIEKIPDDKLRTVDELQVNRIIDVKPKPQNDKEKIVSKTTENESFDIIALDEFHEIEKVTTIARKTSQNLTNRFKALFERNINDNTNTQRMKFNKLTFMTLYPEFIRKWSTVDPRTSKQPNDEISLKQTIRSVSRNTQSPYRKPKATTKSRYNIRAKNTETPANAYARPMQKLNWNRKATPKKNVRRPEVSKSKRIRRLIVREKLKGYRHPLEVTSKVNDKRKNDLSSELLNSDDNISTEEMDSKTPYRKRKNNFRRDFFIDLNFAQPEKEFKVVTNRRIYEPNEYLKSKYQKSNKHINGMSNEKLQKTPPTSYENIDSKNYTDVEISVLRGTQDTNNMLSDKTEFKNNIKDKSFRKFNRVGNKFKKITDQKFHFKNNYKDNLTSKTFIDLQNTGIKNSGVIRPMNETNNSIYKKNLGRSNQYHRSDANKDTRRMTNEQDMQTNTNAQIDKSNKVDSMRNCRNYFNEYSSTARRKKIYFSYLNDNGKTDGYDLFYNQRIARASKENITTIKYQDDKYNTNYISITREAEKATSILEGRKNDGNYFKDTFNIHDENILYKTNLINQIKNNIEINKLNNDTNKKDELNDSENMSDRKEITTVKIIVDKIDDFGIKRNKNLHTGNFIRYNNENVDSLRRNKEEPIEVPNRIIIDNGKFRSEDDTNKLKEIKESMVSSKVTETDLNQQRRTSEKSDFKLSNINDKDFIKRQEDTVIDIKYSTPYFEPITALVPTEKSTIEVDKTIRFTTNTIKSNLKEINDLKTSISSGLTTKNAIINYSNGGELDKLKQVKYAISSESNKKVITPVPKIDDHIKATNTTLSNFNVTGDVISKLV